MKGMALLLATSVFISMMGAAGRKSGWTLTVRLQVILLGGLCPSLQMAVLLPLVPMAMMGMALFLATSVFSSMMGAAGHKLDRILMARLQMIILGGLCPSLQM